SEGERPVDALSPKLQAIAVGNADRLRERAAGKTIGDLRDGEPPIDTDLEIVEVDPRMGVEASTQLFEPMTWVGVPETRRVYIRGLRDAVIPPDHALVMAANANVHETIDIDAEHDMAASAPEALAATLDRLAT
ncbi:MAG: hypothetical protein ACRDJ5_09410, partial [Actinomycetota bacterium]